MPCQSGLWDEVEDPEEKTPDQLQGKLFYSWLEPCSSKLEWVFMKHYAPNVCLPLKITWKQDAKVRKVA